VLLSASVLTDFLIFVYAAGANSESFLLLYLLLNEGEVLLLFDERSSIETDPFMEVTPGPYESLNGDRFFRLASGLRPVSLLKFLRKNFPVLFCALGDG